MASRSERAAEAARLRDEGLNGPQIAERLGISKSYAYELLADPDGLKLRARHERHRGTCVDCGTPTSWPGSHGRADRCVKCAHENQRVWTRETVVAAIRRFADRNGRPPTATDLNPAQARWLGHDWRVEHFYECGDYPGLSTVQAVFGKFSTALEAAGFTSVGFGYLRADGRGTHLPEAA